MKHYLDDYVINLLHINDAKSNKLIDLMGADPKKVYFLSREDNDNFSEYMLLNIEKSIGHIASTVLQDSSLAKSQISVGRNLSSLSWENGEGQRDPKALDKFIQETYKDISFKGINPLFLSVGAVKWRVQISQKEIRDVLSPLLIFPIKLIRSGNASPVSIEFVDDEVYFNPCFYKKMEQTLLGETAEGFPRPIGAERSFDDPIDLTALSDGNDYFRLVERYMRSCAQDSDAPFQLLKNTVAIAQYNHSDLCMYYDFRRNRDTVLNHPLVKAVFDPTGDPLPKAEGEASSYPYFVLPHDSVQEDMILRAINGESMVIKGPPGTGKTVTIANMISTLLAERKSVLLASSKIPALEEVYHKLPENLRKFALLLDYESEAEAAKINPAIIKKDLSDLIESARKSNISDAVYEERNSARTEKNGALTDIEEYHKLVFGTPAILGDNYYTALDRYCRHPEIRTVKFAPPQDILKLKAEDFLALCSAVRSAGKEFEKMTKEGKESIFRNPWYGIDETVDTEKAFSYAEKIAERIEAILLRTGEIFSALPQNLPVSTLHPMHLTWLADGKSVPLPAEKLRSAKLTEEQSESLCKLLDTYLSAVAEDDTFAPSTPLLENLDSALRIYAKLDSIPLQDDVTLAELRLLKEKKELFRDVRGIFLNRDSTTALIGMADRIESERALREEHRAKVFETFRVPQFEEDENKLRSAYTALQKYVDSDAEAPSALDFKAKSALKQILPLAYLPTTPFRELVAAVNELHIADTHQEQIGVTVGEISRFYKKELTENQAAEILSVIGYAKRATRGLEALFADVDAAAEIALPFAEATRSGDDTTLALLKARYRMLTCYRELQKGIEEVELRAEHSFAGHRAEAVAKALLAWNGLLQNEKLCTYTSSELDATVAALQNLPADYIDDLRRLLTAFYLFGEEMFRNYYTLAPESVCFDDLRYYAENARDRAMLGAALQYHGITEKSTNPLPLDAFFRPFEFRELTRLPEFDYADYFERSVYGIAILGYMILMKSKRNVAGRELAGAFHKIRNAEESVETVNRQIIEKKLLSYVRPDDVDYRFLSHERASGTSVRKLFKDHGEAILKLKKCMILSPSTASVLFRGPEFAKFDVVIIDEASQMESVTLLPILSRAKQCILVGDEWQMPPIKHFEAKNDVVTDEDELLPEPSALSLVLRNAPFHTTQLVCHYRSRTESLIAFSQEKFYPNMRTFPSPIPKQDNLGFKDIYIENGVCVDGVNELEAQQTVECIKEHFRRYYDEESGKLTRSFGVVTFGLPQLKRIESIIKKDELLRKRYNHTGEKNDVDDPFFYCTVESVQGQQTTDLFLSMTYTGHSSLSDNEQSSQIFNVAVSRATDSVTVIHSRKSMDIKPEFVGKYLEKVEYFTSDYHSPFVSHEPDPGFLMQVRDYVVTTFGIDKDRVLCHYGATEGSVRIPLVILDPEKKQAQLGIFCELPVDKKYNYIDYHVKYYNILSSLRGWNLHRIFIHDWVDNNDAEKKLLDDMIKKYVSLDRDTV